MLANILNQNSIKYLEAKEQALSQASLDCNCDDPGKKIECRDCKCFIEVCDEIQIILYGDEAHRQGSILSKAKILPQGLNKKAYSEETKTKCIDLYAKLRSITEVEKVTNIPFGTIRRWLKLAGIELSEHSIVYTIELKQKCVDLYNELGSYKKVEKLFGYSFSTIRRWVKESKLGKLEESCNRYKHSKDLKQKAINLYKIEGNKSKIHRELGVSIGTLTLWLMEEGIDTKDIITTKKGKYSKEKKQQCVDIFKRTNSYQATYLETGIHPDTIRLWVKKYNLATT